MYHISFSPANLPTFEQVMRTCMTYQPAELAMGAEKGKREEISHYDIYIKLKTKFARPDAFKRSFLNKFHNITNDKYEWSEIELKNIKFYDCEDSSQNRLYQIGYALKEGNETVKFGLSPEDITLALKEWETTSKPIRSNKKEKEEKEPRMTVDKIVEEFRLWLKEPSESGQIIRTPISEQMIEIYFKTFITKLRDQNRLKFSVVQKINKQALAWYLSG